LIALRKRWYRTKRLAESRIVSENNDCSGMQGENKGEKMMGGNQRINGIAGKRTKGLVGAGGVLGDFGRRGVKNVWPLEERVAVTLFKNTSTNGVFRYTRNLR